MLHTYITVSERKRSVLIFVELFFFFFYCYHHQDKNNILSEENTPLLILVLRKYHEYCILETYCSTYMCQNLFLFQCPLPLSPLGSIATRFLEEEELRSHHILERLDAHIEELKRESEKTVKQFTVLKQPLKNHKLGNKNKH